MATVPEEIRQNGWRQGDLIVGDCIAPLLASSIDFLDCETACTDVLLLISQDCDLVSDTLDKEPYAEFLAGRFIASCDASLRFGRNPRTLHLEAISRSVEFSIHDRFRVLKESLNEYGIRMVPQSLGASEKRLVLDWITKRYIRPAFPDTFNIRLNQKRREQDTLAKSPLSEKVLIVLLDISNDEYPPERSYELQILIGVIEGTPKDSIEQIERAYEEAFTVPGITVADIAVREEIDITLRELRTYKRWDRDYRSYPESPDVALPPSGL
ncbi:MAG: hypothetical protein EWM51_03145 [Treponema sp.]|nr:MAG: hypothetical protein EWM51_03145 [Treponema sp.]